MYQRPLFIALSALVLGVVIGAAVMAWSSSPADASASDSSASDSTSPSAQAGSSSASGLAAYDKDGDGMVYRSGMHPDIIRDEPGNCPICGMRLTPTPVGSGGSDGAVQISPVTLQNIGVRTAQVSVETLTREVRSTGVFEANPQGMSAVSPKVSGWIDALHVDYEGARVRRGQALFDIYSPELVATQEEYLSAIRTAERLEGEDAGSNRLVEAAKRRLAYWDISDKQIERLRETGTPQRTLTFYAQNSGVVSRLSVTEGEKISAGQTLMHISDLNPLWLMVDLYEQDLAWIDEGATAQVELPYRPGETIEGRVDYIYDRVDTNTRTVKARIAVPNPQRTLKPGMYATVRLRGGESDPLPVVPQEAVVSSGERDIVILALGDGKFRPVPVKIGRSANGGTQILDGLNGDEQVVTSAQFLIDSEARLQGALSAMTRDESSSGMSGEMTGDMNHDDHSESGDSEMEMSGMDSSEHGETDVHMDGPVAVTAGQGGFSPGRIALPVGQTTTLVFTRTTARTCATEVVIPGLDIGPVNLPLNEPTEIEVTPTETGKFTFTCGMDMYRGNLVVVEASR